MKKKLLSLLLVTGLVAGLAVGCGSAKESNESEETTTEVTENIEAASNEGVTASKVNIAIQPSGAFIPLIIAREEGWLEE